MEKEKHTVRIPLLVFFGGGFDKDPRVELEKEEERRTVVGYRSIGSR